MLIDDARDLALAEFPDGTRAPCLGEQALPALEPRCVLSEGLAKKLAPRAALLPGNLVYLPREGCRDRDRYGALIRHAPNVTEILITFPPEERDRSRFLPGVGGVVRRAWISRTTFWPDTLVLSCDQKSGQEVLPI